MNNVSLEPPSKLAPPPTGNLSLSKSPREEQQASLEHYLPSRETTARSISGRVLLFPQNPSKPAGESASSVSDLAVDTAMHSKELIYLQNKFAAYTQEEIPDDVKAIIGLRDDGSRPAFLSLTTLTPANIETLKCFIKKREAEDTLVVWKAIAHCAKIEESFPKDASTEDLVKTASAFPGWVERHQEQLQTVTILNLEGNQLTSVPKELGKLSGLTTLHLDRNQLSSIPRELGLLVNLKQLNLGENRLTSIPTELGKLTNLWRLQLGYNQLRFVPKELGNLKELRWLHLNNNQLSFVPTELGQLVNLWRLNLASNQLISMPGLDKLANLRKLNIRQNQLSMAPPGLEQLAHLQELDLRENQLTSVSTKVFSHLQELELMVPPTESQALSASRSSDSSLSFNGAMIVGVASAVATLALSYLGSYIYRNETMPE